MRAGSSLIRPLFMKSALPHKTPVFILLIIALTFSVYSFSVQDSFKTLDDEKVIVTNQDIRSFSGIPRIFSTSFFGKRSYYRPLVISSHLLEYQVAGLNAVFYYWINILIHTASALILFVLLKRMLRRETLSFLAALLFAVHPVQWEAVSNIPGRAILLAAFFTLAAFYLFCRGRTWDYPAALLLFSCGLLSKESTGVFPLALVAYQGLLIQPRPVSRPEWLKRLRPVLPFFLLLIFYVILRRSLGITNVYLWRSVPEALLGFLTFLRGALTYVRLLIWPVDCYFDRTRILFGSFLQVELILTVVVFLCGLFLLYRYRRSVSAVTKFFLLWTVIEFLPVCQILFTIGVQPGMVSIAEHFLYLPMVGIAAIAVITGEHVYRKILSLPNRPVSPIILQMGIAGLYIFFMLTTIQLNIYARSETAMFERSIRFNPANVRIRNSLGINYAKAGRFREAQHQFEQALVFNPDDVKARIGLGKALCDQGKYWQGLAEYGKVQNAGLHQETLQTNRRLTRELLMRQLRRAWTQNPLDARIYYSLGVLYSEQGDSVKARGNFQQALELNPDYSEALFNLASLEEAQGNISQAITFFNKVLDLPSTHRRLAYMTLLRLQALYDKTGAAALAEDTRQRAEVLKKGLRRQ